MARSQDMLAAGRVAAAGSALAAHGVDLSDTASLQLALHGAGIHGLHALDDVAQVSRADCFSIINSQPLLGLLIVFFHFTQLIVNQMTYVTYISNVVDSNRCLCEH